MKISSKKGISSIAAALTLLILLALGGVLTYLVAAGSLGQAHQISSTQAFYVVQAGIEYAVKRIYDSLNELVPPPGKTFAEGSFTVTRSGRTITVTGTVGDAVRVHSVDSPTEADCTEIDVSSINLTHGDKRISGITFRKICLASITLDKMQVSWVEDDGEKVKEVKIENTIVYTNPPGVPSGTLLELIDWVVTGPNNNAMNWIEFNDEMEEKEVTLSFIMGDGTTKTVTFETED